MINILFTGVGRRIELIQAFRTAALVLKKDIKIFGADITKTAPALAYCDDIKIVKPMRDPGYIDSLLTICKEEKITIVIPTIDTDLLVLSQNKSKFEEIGVKVLISAPDKIQICRDKNNTSQFFVDCGLHAPMPVNDWKKYDSGFPAFIKPKDGSSSIDAYKVNNSKELETYAGQIDDYIVQPFIDGTEYTIDAFCDFDGEPIFITPRQRVQVRAGEVLKTQIDLDETAIEETKKLCEQFKPCGPATIQFIKQKETNVNYYIEINPRFGGGAPLSMKAGAKSAEALLKLLDGESIETDEYNIVNDSIYSRFDQSVCILGGNQKIKGIIFDLDDTLYNEIDYIKSGFKAISETLDNPNAYDMLLKYFEERKAPLDKLVAELKIKSEKPKLLDIYRNHAPNIKLGDDTLKMLKELKENGVKLGIITDGRPNGQKAKIQTLGLDKIIDDIIITDALGGAQFRKPNDISFRIIQNRWRLNAEEIVYVGDNLTKDPQAPKQLGIQFIYLNNKNGLYSTDKKAQYITINKLSDIKELI